MIRLIASKTWRDRKTRHGLDARQREAGWRQWPLRPGGGRAWPTAPERPAGEDAGPEAERPALRSLAPGPPAAWLREVPPPSSQPRAAGRQEVLPGGAATTRPSAKLFAKPLERCLPRSKRSVDIVCAPRPRQRDRRRYVDMLTYVWLVSENVFEESEAALLLREDSRRSGSRWSERVAYSQYCFVPIFF